MIFAFARDGLLPGWFAWLHPRKAIPTNAILAYVACAFLTAISGSFLELVVLASLAVVAIYVMACAAAYVLQRRDVARAGKPLRIPGLPVAAVLGFAGMLAITVSAQWSEIGGLIATISASLALYWLMTRWRTR